MDIGTAYAPVCSAVHRCVPRSEVRTHLGAAQATNIQSQMYMPAWALLVLYSERKRDKCTRGHAQLSR